MNNNNMTYGLDIPALPGLASGVDDGPALAAIAAGTPLDEENLRLARNQHANRKRLAKSIPPLATEAEVMASKRRKHTVESVHFDGAAPAWAQQMQQQMQQMHQHLSRQILQESARSMNRSRRQVSDHIEPLVRLEDGRSPNEEPHTLYFPADQEQLMTMTGNQTNDLLVFYSIQTNGNVTDRRRRLMRHLGVTL